MAPPDWLLEKRPTPEERKQRARERMAAILEKQAEEAKASTRHVAPAVQSPSTPVLGVSLQRLQQNEQRSPDPANDARRGSASRSTDSSDTSDAHEPPKQVQPIWYTSMRQQKWQQTGSSRNNVGTNRNVDAKLEQVKHLIKKCKEEEHGAEAHRLFDQIRDELHDLVFLQVSDVALRRKRMLHDDSGLPQLFDMAFPWDIRADALELYNRWALRVFSIDLLRGIIKRQATAGNRSTDRIDPAYPGKERADYYGEGSLVNGQWWPTQLCTVRDGAHGSTQGGIYATKGKPAYSIVLSGSHYQDRDEGEQIWYSGTDGKDGKASDNTQSLMLNITSGREVRVIRSHNLSARAATYRPPRGFRYDGCYEVLSYQVVDGAKMACLFHLRRKTNQDPIRFHGKEMRPTDAEVREYDKFRAEIEASERI
ncbi:sra-ydg domain-containing protein [Diplodia corticola]|uniref:Sra-ydg domain-containing protein n=1 Tax=Diplodia corticola TaxID=236234 RepID=A0A1J9S468_9PEZI|nr:sra-ydg domain-containing protein [Diplodia corticola]OJD34429.1 sra-ydg domain-containing protein [Diplodia corticola]